MLSKEEIEYIEDLEKAIEDNDSFYWQEDMYELIEIIRKQHGREQKLIEKLEKDTVNITKTMQDGKHCDDYSRCRLKAYRTKTKEILSILKGE